MVCIGACNVHTTKNWLYVWRFIHVQKYYPLHQTLAMSIFELASHNKCHYATLNKEKVGQSEQPTGELQGKSYALRVSFFFTPFHFFFFAVFPEASPPACLLHAVFRSQSKSADFPLKSLPLLQEQVSIKHLCSSWWKGGKRRSCSSKNSTLLVECRTRVGE